MLVVVFLPLLLITLCLLSFSGGEIHSLHINGICISALDLQELDGQLWLKILWNIQLWFSVLQEPSIKLSYRMAYLKHTAHYVMYLLACLSISLCYINTLTLHEKTAGFITSDWVGSADSLSMVCLNNYFKWVECKLKHSSWTSIWFVCANIYYTQSALLVEC